MRAVQFTERVLYDPSGIIYIDPATNRAYPWVIDSSRFTAAYLEKAVVPNPQDLISAKLQLTAEGSKDTKTIYYNQQSYEQSKKTINTNSQAFIERSLFVLMHNPETNVRIPAILIIQMITPKGSRCYNY